jgi:hypothetical protein
MVILKYVNIALRFLLELCALGALGYWGFHTGNGTILKMVLGIGAPLMMAVIWGAFGSPKAMVKLSVPWHLLFESIVFAIPAVALYFAGKHTLAWIYGISVVINRLMMFVWRR